MNSHAIVYVPTKVGEGFFTDFQPPASGSTDNGKVWSWNNLAGKFIPTSLDFEPLGQSAIAAASAVSAHVALPNPHTQYFLASGVSGFGATLIDDADAATARTTLGLGTAAVLNVGTGANNVVQLDGSARLPAVDGSQLTGISGGSVAGSNTQVIYNASGVYAGHSGMTYSSANSRLTVAGGIIAGDWSPPSDSTTAVSIWNAARSARVVTVDTTNSRVGIGGGSSTINRNLAILSTNTLSFLQIANSDTGYGVDDGFLVGMASTYAYFVNKENNNIEFGTNNTTRIILTGAGLMSINSTTPTTPTAQLDVGASTTARASLRIRTGVAPTSPNDGDFWTTTAGAFLRISGVTYSVNLTAV